ncbi:MAG: pyridoxal-phosphate dependent enzyme, partial [Hymenobacter sp.]
TAENEDSMLARRQASAVAQQGRQRQGGRGLHYQAGQVVEWAAADTNRTLADGVRTLALSELTLAHLRQYADDMVTVSETELRAAARRLLLEARLVVEPTAALPLAALLRHRASLPPSQHTVLILSGGNADPATLAELLRD